jgi:hypothetical protein
MLLYRRWGSGELILRESLTKSGESKWIPEQPTPPCLSPFLYCSPSSTPHDMLAPDCDSGLSSQGSCAKPQITAPVWAQGFSSRLVQHPCTTQGFTTVASLNIQRWLLHIYLFLDFVCHFKIQFLSGSYKNNVHHKTAHLTVLVPYMCLWRAWDISKPGYKCPHQDTWAPK